MSLLENQAAVAYAGLTDLELILFALKSQAHLPEVWLGDTFTTAVKTGQVDVDRESIEVANQVLAPVGVTIAAFRHGKCTFKLAPTSAVPPAWLQEWRAASLMGYEERLWFVLQRRLPYILSVQDVPFDLWTPPTHEVIACKYRPVLVPVLAKLNVQLAEHHMVCVITEKKLGRIEYTPERQLEIRDIVVKKARERMDIT